MDKLSELDFLIGGVGFVSGLLLAAIFGGDKGGCGCGPKTAQVPQFLSPPADPLTSAKLVGTGVTQPSQTLGRLTGSRTMGSVEAPGNGGGDWCTGFTNQCVRCWRDFSGQCYCKQTGKCSNFWDFLGAT